MEYMDYLTLKEASEKWGISSRQINYYCTNGRIPGAEKMGDSLANIERFRKAY